MKSVDANGADIEKKDQIELESNPPSAKKKYKKPCLVPHGDVSELTLNSGGSNADGSGYS